MGLARIVCLFVIFPNLLEATFAYDHSVVFQGGATLPVPDAETKEIQVTGQTSGTRELSSNIPPTPAGFDRSRSGEGTPSSPGGFLRGLSFTKKKFLFDVEETSLLNADSEDNRYIGTNNRPAFSWKRSTSLPVAHGSNLSTSTAMPSSAPFHAEQHEVLIVHLLFLLFFIESLH